MFYCSMCGIECDGFFEDTVPMCDECYDDQIRLRLLEANDGKVQ